MFKNPFLTRIPYSSWLQKEKKILELILPSDWISLALGFKFGSNQVRFITFLCQYIKPYHKLLKLYILSIGVDIALYLKF